jgi:hypothetical protein
VVVGVGEVEAAAEEAVEGALGDEGLQVGDPSTVVAGAVAELPGGGSNDPQDRPASLAGSSPRWRRRWSMARAFSRGPS